MIIIARQYMEADIKNTKENITMDGYAVWPWFKW